MSLVERYRNSISQLALEAEGAHYLHGSFGNHPNACNGHPARDSRLRIASNRYRESTAGSLVIHAAFTHVERQQFCLGRPMHADVRRLQSIPGATLRDAAALESFTHSARPREYRWPRTDNGRMGAPVHQGESCEGRRHFDCIGLVSWVMFRVFGTQTIRDIAQCQQYARAELPHNPDLAVPRPNLQVGDIAIFNISHIGIAIGRHELIEANGENYGVIRNARFGNPTDVLRPTDELLRRVWNVRA